MTRVYSEESVFKDIYDKMEGKAVTSHTHPASQITDFEDEVGDIVDARISTLIGGAPTALDTLNELAAALGDDPNYAATITNALSNKVDKVSGKGLSTEDFTTDLKSKLNGIPSDTESRIAAIEAWKSSMPKKSVKFTGTTDSNGDITIDMTSAGFTAVPSIGVTYIFNNNNYGTHYNVKALSTTSVTLRVMRNKDTAVLLGGNVDPDEPLASTNIVLIATEY